MAIFKGLAVLFVLYVILLNLIASYRVLHDEFYTPIQKTVQTLFIWLLPLIGAITVSYFLAPKPADKWWQRHWLSAGLLSWLLQIRYAQKKSNRHSDRLDNSGSDIDGNYSDHHNYDSFGGGDGGFGGGE